MKEKAIIFDFNGTIADTSKIAFDAINKMSEKYNYKKLTFKEANSLRDKGMMEIIKMYKVPFYKVPFILKDVRKEDLDKEILRLGIMAELDAVSLYEQLAAKTSNAKIKDVLLDIAKEEKTHVGEFQAMLLRLDKEQEQELKEGKKEVDKLA